MSSRTYCLITLTMFVTFGSDVFADKETSIAGQQLIIARYTNTPAVIDGVVAPGEWTAAIPVHVKANHPATAPGLVPNLPDLLLFPPDNQDDSSYTIYTMYDDDNLYVAVNVADDIRINDGPVAFLDDDVELFIDGDKQPFDLLAALVCGPSNPDCPEPVINNEGFQILTSVGGDRATLPDNNPAIVWESKTGPRPRGFLAEFRIPLDSINTIDTSFFTDGDPSAGFRKPSPGDTIGFNVTVGDDDNGGDSYLRSEPGVHTDNYIAWDGSSLNWNAGAEQDWGSLYLAPVDA
jgi:Carbohydrate family 9 binding domain-like